MILNLFTRFSCLTEQHVDSNDLNHIPFNAIAMLTSFFFFFVDENSSLSLFLSISLLYFYCILYNCIDDENSLYICISVSVLTVFFVIVKSWFIMMWFESWELGKKIGSFFFFGFILSKKKENVIFSNSCSIIIISACRYRCYYVLCCERRLANVLSLYLSPSLANIFFVSLVNEWRNIMKCREPF